MSFATIGIITGATLLVGGTGVTAAGTMMQAAKKGERPKPNPAALNILNQVMAEYWNVKREFRDLLKSKPWAVDYNQVKKINSIMPQLDEAVKAKDPNRARSLISQIPVFEDLYKDKILFKFPHISRMLQDTAMTWGMGLRTPAQERLQEDITGSSRRMLGRQRDENLRQAERMAILRGRPGLAAGESARITGDYLKAYGEQEKQIRMRETEDLLRYMVMGSEMATRERAYGAGQVQQGVQNKFQAQQLVNQLLSAASGAAGRAAPTGGTPGGGGAAAGLAGVGGQVAGLGENVMGFTMMQDYLNRRGTTGTSDAYFRSQLDTTPGVSPFEAGAGAGFSAGFDADAYYRNPRRLSPGRIGQIYPSSF